MRDVDYFLDPAYSEKWVRAVRSNTTLNERCEVVLDVLGVRPGETILDVGAGEGRFMPLITGRGAYYVGVDISPHMLAHAKSRMHGDGRALCDLVVADARHLPFRDKVVDRALCYATAFVIPEQEEVGREMRRVAKKLMLVEVSSLLNPRALRGAILNRIRKLLGRRYLPYFPLKPKDVLRIFRRPRIYYFTGDNRLRSGGSWPFRLNLIVVEDIDGHG